MTDMPHAAMTRTRIVALSRYLLQGHVPRRGCLRLANERVHRAAPGLVLHRKLHDEFNTGSMVTAAPAVKAPTPLRKQLKDEAKAAKAASKNKKKYKANNQVVDGWELTVGIEIHAQLNTARKLFSPATTSFNDEPNSHVAFFDLAIPGSQPVFQKETLIPALRAALALNCDIQRTSRFDRKHYFHWDQPSGYQITQYYEPFARNGHITLGPRDGIAAEDGEGITVGIQQVQMEQDTAKTMAQAGEVHWVDFNRTGVPLIEIITRPDIHHPATAAALVRKVQMMLSAVDACVSGMEVGGLRADVNVSVRRTDGSCAPLGTRTEIKNLSSFKSVEDAIIAERDRQIALLESGGVVEGETRGWSIGSTETRRLRGKEGEVDYRYMPDPDLGPVVIGDDLVAHLRAGLGQLPDAEVKELMGKFGITAKDALSLIALDNGCRVEYFWNVVEGLSEKLQTDRLGVDHQAAHQLAANWVLHELGRLTADRQDETSEDLVFSPAGNCEQVPVTDLTDILYYLHTKRITAKVAKELLWVVYRGGVPEQYPNIQAAIETEDMWFHELSEDEYADLADRIVDGQDAVIAQFAELKQYPQGKLMFLVGRMLRMGAEERIDPKSAERILRQRIEEVYVPRMKQ
jgi:aspartyl-tRNA(Asn)/glutamyl-tRNA(Gln) amidotransferase subunit B